MISLLLAESEIVKISPLQQEAVVQPSNAVPAKQGPEPSLALSIPGT